ncbi:saccharopine dehydrogenase NADP-binding domain-containing protein [Lysobacter sp. CA199]|uniref:saccharopine dehydrogenase NADP-binding domain-containing protein n=1 Tax=Lysobacter sp. CA199 TaxID=3455608 RepID=UPI003F8D4DB3
MSSQCDLAVLGGYGDVGFEASRAWLRLRALAGMDARLRIGGRDLHAARESVERLRAIATDSGRAARTITIEAMAVDLFDAESLRAFVTGSRAVLNCAGPSHRIGDRVARTAREANADYIDAAGDDALHALLDPADYQRSGRRALLSAGMQPGLSALLPRWLASYLTRPLRLTSYLGLNDRFTAVAADDYLHGAADGSSEPLAAWRDHGRRAGASRRQRDTTLPFFNGPVTVLPYLNREGERLARALDLRDGDWHSAIEGRHVLAAFDRAHALPREDAIALLRHASALDLAGRRPQATLLCQLDGEHSSVSALLRAPGNAALSGGFAAVAVQAALNESIAPGRYYAAMTMDPASSLQALRDCGAVDVLNRFDAPIPTEVLTEEGAL